MCSIEVVRCLYTAVQLGFTAVVGTVKGIFFAQM
jgi:hypothetical protein